MLQHFLATFYNRDLLKLTDELKLFKVGENLWKTAGSVNNSCGNLVMHIIGGLNYLIGARLGNTGYIRNREREFSGKAVAKAALLAQMEELIPIINKTLAGLSDEQMEADYPIPFDNAIRSNSYVLVQLLVHLNYHIGQVNYLRRILE